MVQVDQTGSQPFLFTSSQIRPARRRMQIALVTETYCRMKVCVRPRRRGNESILCEILDSHRARLVPNCKDEQGYVRSIRLIVQY
jgi:hypothetical protein